MKTQSLNGQIRKDEVNAYFENLTGVSNWTLHSQIKQRRTLLARMSVRRRNTERLRRVTKILPELIPVTN